MKKFFIAALCVGLFVTAGFVWAQQANKVQPKANVVNAEKVSTATTATTKACCADMKACSAAAKACDKKACSADKKDCCADMKACDKKACCTDMKACDKKATTCCVNKVAPVENKSSGKK